MRVPRKPAGRWSRWALGTGLSLACFLCLGLGLPHWTRERTRRFWQAPRARRWGAAWGCVGLLSQLRLGHGARWARSPASLADHGLRRQALYDAGDVGYFHLRVTWLPVRPGFLPGTPTAAGLATAPPDSHRTSLPDVRVPLCRCRLPREGRVLRPREWTVPPTAPGSAVVKLQGPLSSLKFPGLKNSVPVADRSRWEEEASFSMSRIQGALGTDDLLLDPQWRNCPPRS